METFGESFAPLEPCEVERALTLGVCAVSNDVAAVLVRLPGVLGRDRELSEARACSGTALEED